MKDLNYISSEISKAHQLDTNLEKYATGIASMYHGLAYIKLSMDYYTVFDMLREKPFDAGNFSTLLSQLNDVIESKILAAPKLKEEESARQNFMDQTIEIENIRNNIISVMEVVTAYVDRLRIYEYALNRVEYRFLDENPDDTYYGTYLTNDLMHYIFSDKDNVVINAKISEIVGQLPMRLSKSKFYEYISEAFTLYHGAQKGTIDDFAYALRTSALLGEIHQDALLFPEVEDICQTLSHADYNDLDEAQFLRLKGALTIAAERMSECADMFVLLAQLVNDVYTIILTQNHTVGAVDEISIAREIIRSVKDGFDHPEIHPDDAVLEKFVSFEGKQERIIGIVGQCDYAIDFAKANFQEKINAQGLTYIYDALVWVTKLQSGSDFVNLHEEESHRRIPDNSYADEVAAQLITQIDASFKDQQQLMKRAVMSSVLSQLPVFFNNTDEIQQYINFSLEQCNDPAERMAVIEVMKMIMEQTQV